MRATISKSNIEKFIDDHKFEKETVYVVALSKTVPSSQSPHFDKITNTIHVTGLEDDNLISLTIETFSRHRINATKESLDEMSKKSDTMVEAITDKLKQKGLTVKNGIISDEQILGESL